MQSKADDFSAALEPKDGGTLVRVKAVPGSSRDVIAGMLGDRIKVRISAPPEQGKANAAITSLFAAKLGVPKGAVSLVSGSSRPLKTLLIVGMDPWAVAAKIRG